MPVIVLKYILTYFYVLNTYGVCEKIFFNVGYLFLLSVFGWWKDNKIKRIMIYFSFICLERKGVFDVYFINNNRNHSDL